MKYMETMTATAMRIKDKEQGDKLHFNPIKRKLSIKLYMKPCNMQHNCIKRNKQLPQPRSIVRYCHGQGNRTLKGVKEIVIIMKIICKIQ